MSKTDSLFKARRNSSDYLPSILYKRRVKLILKGGYRVFSKDVGRTDLALLTIASAALTIPFIFYAKDIADSLRFIAERKSPLQ
ncbi:MAG: hypothetical protein M1130_00985 [Actinobacteria bacterium]|nr:hypothetical protein [Actinomycetota bacterium]